MVGVSASTIRRPIALMLQPLASTWATGGLVPRAVMYATNRTGMRTATEVRTETASPTVRGTATATIVGTIGTAGATVIGILMDATVGTGESVAARHPLVAVADGTVLTEDAGATVGARREEREAAPFESLGTTMLSRRRRPPRA